MVYGSLEFPTCNLVVAHMGVNLSKSATHLYSIVYESWTSIKDFTGHEAQIAHMHPWCSVAIVSIVNNETIDSLLFLKALRNASNNVRLTMRVLPRP